MDIANLHNNEWLRLVSAWQKGTLERQQVLDLLASDEPVPEGAKPMLASVISGDYKFKRGNKPTSVFTKYPREGATARYLVGVVERHIKDPDEIPDDAPADYKQRIQAAHERANYKNRKSETANMQAKRMVADLYGVEPPTLKKAMPPSE